MKRRPKRICRPLLLVLLASCSGCAGLTLPSTRTVDVQAQAAERKAEVTRDFEQKRDQAQYQAALSRVRQNDVDGCRQMLAELLERNPGHYDARLLQVELLLLADELREAKQQIEYLLTERPENPAAHHAAGLLLEAEGNLTQAVAHFEQAVRFAPDNSAYRTNLQFTQAALTDLKTGGARGITRVSGSPTVSGSGPAYHFVKPPDSAPSSKVVNASAVDGPTEAIRSATVLIQSNQPSQARELLETAKSRFPDSAPVYRSLALACYRSGDYQASYDALQTALSLDSTNGLSYFLMGCTLSKLGERQAAETHFARAAALDSRFAQAAASAL